MMHSTKDFDIHMMVIRNCVAHGLGFVATEKDGVYYIEFTGGY